MDRPSNRLSGNDISPLPVDRLGDFEIMEILGQGGMGAVYLAFDRELKRHVALKVLRQDLPDIATYIKRFRHEAQAVARLNHPGIVQIYSSGTQGNYAYFAMEYIEGASLKDLCDRERRLAPRTALNYVRQAAEALRYASEAGIIHRDIKPGNLLVGSGGQVKICDFGLAKSTRVDGALTQTGIVLGSPHYMSPEQSRSLTVDYRTDIYSLGATLFNLINGDPPFERTSQFDILKAHIQDPVPRPGILVQFADGRLMAFIEKMMAKDPDDRPQDYREIVVEIDTLLQLMDEEAGVHTQETTKPEVTPPKKAEEKREDTPPQVHRPSATRGLVLLLFLAGVLGFGWLAVQQYAPQSMRDKHPALFPKPSDTDRPDGPPTKKPPPRGTDELDPLPTELPPVSAEKRLAQLRPALAPCKRRYRYQTALDYLGKAIDDDAMSAADRETARKAGRVFNILRLFKIELLKQIDQLDDFTVMSLHFRGSVMVFSATDDKVTILRSGERERMTLSWHILPPADLYAIAHQTFDKQSDEGKYLLSTFYQFYELQSVTGARPPLDNNKVFNEDVAGALVFLKGENDEKRSP